MGRPNICTWFGSNRIIKWGSFGEFFGFFSKSLIVLPLVLAPFSQKFWWVTPYVRNNFEIWPCLGKFSDLSNYQHPERFSQIKDKMEEKTNWYKFGETTWCWKLHYNVWILIGISQENEKQLKTIKCSPISWSLGHENIGFHWIFTRNKC